MQELYFDNNATTQLSPHVLAELKNILDSSYGNPSGVYSIAKRARLLIEKARSIVANFIGATSHNTMIFTSGATESNNAVINSCVKRFPQKRHIISTAIEHSSIINPLRRLEKVGYKIDYLKVDNCGRIDLSELKKKLSLDTLLVSVMLVNNEIGNIYPIEEVRQICKGVSAEILVHTDAVQAVGKFDFDVKCLGIDFLSLSGHKFHAPKGIGCLYIKEPSDFIPLLDGGNQESGHRSGTENVHYIVALGKAVEELSLIDIDKIKARRDRIENGLLHSFHDMMVLGDRDNRICTTANVLFPWTDGVILTEALSEVGVFVSSGSACSEKGKGQSHVLSAMGIEGKGIRISLSRFTSDDDVLGFLRKAIPVIKKFKK
jgi:cysteine desulfurase